MCALAQVVENAVRAVRHLRSLGCEDIEFSPEDAGRSDPKFLYRVLEAVIEAGATTLNIPDTTGMCDDAKAGSSWARQHMSFICRTLSRNNVWYAAHIASDAGSYASHATASGRDQLSCRSIQEGQSLRHEAHACKMNGGSMLRRLESAARVWGPDSRPARQHARGGPRGVLHPLPERPGPLDRQQPCGRHGRRSPDRMHDQRHWGARRKRFLGRGRDGHQQAGVGHRDAQQVERLCRKSSQRLDLLYSTRSLPDLTNMAYTTEPMACWCTLAWSIPTRVPLVEFAWCHLASDLF